MALLSERRKQPLSPLVLLRPNDELIEIGVFEQSHATRPLACHARALGSSMKAPKSKRECGFSELRSRASDARSLLILSPNAPRIARTRGGSVDATRMSRSNLAPSRSSVEALCTVARGSSSLVRPASRKNSSNAPSASVSELQAAGRLVWTSVSCPMSFRGRLPALVATSRRRGACVDRPRRFAAAMPAGNTAARPTASSASTAGFGLLRPIAVVRDR